MSVMEAIQEIVSPSQELVAMQAISQKLANPGQEAVEVMAVIQERVCLELMAAIPARQKRVQNIRQMYLMQEQ